MTSHPYLVHVWQTDDGLPQNWVSSIAQTPDGYLWIGTRYGGLARFDGVRFTSFNQQSTPELKDVQVERLSVDETGRLWIIMGNESITSLQHGRFTLHHAPRSDPRMRVDRVLCVKSNRFLFAAESPSSLPTLDLSAPTNNWELFYPPANLQPDIRSYTLDKSGTVWFTTQNRRLGRFMNDRFALATGVAGLPGPAIVALVSDSNRQMWAAAPRNLLFWNGGEFERRTPTNAPLPQGIQQIALCGDGGV